MAAGEVVGILLAAGAGTRFGGDKLLYRLGGGSPMAVTAARNLRQACGRCVSVLRPEQETLASLLSLERVEIRFDPETERGMGHSLAAAVRATPDAAGWLVALADMPFIAPATMRAVAEALRNGASLAAPVYGQRRGHPVGFARHWFEALAGLQGDQGARELLAAHSGALVRVPCGDPGVLIDVDIPSALDDLSGSPFFAHAR